MFDIDITYIVLSEHTVKKSESEMSHDVVCVIISYKLHCKMNKVLNEDEIVQHNSVLVNMIVINECDDIYLQFGE